jgi:hypothetical protein
VTKKRREKKRKEEKRKEEKRREKKRKEEKRNACNCNTNSFISHFFDFVIS